MLPNELIIDSADHRNRATKAASDVGHALSVLGMNDHDVYSYPGEDVDDVRIDISISDAYRLSELLMSLEAKTL